MGVYAGGAEGPSAATPGMDPTPPAPRSTLAFRAAAALLGVILVAVYVGSLRGEYLWDDTPIVRDNPLLTGLHGLRGLFTTDLWGGATGRSTQLYHPVPMVTLWLQALVTGRSLVAFRVGNLALHAACVALLYAWIRRDRVSPRAALLAVAAFALHPSSVEIVLWVTGRHDSVGALLVLLALHAWMRPNALLAALTVAAAFASKEGFVVAPALLALTVHRAYPDASLRKRASRLAGPVAAVATVFAIRAALGISSRSAQISAPPTELLRQYASIVAHYFAQVVSFRAGPTIQSYDSLAPWQAWAVFVAIAGVLAGLLALRHRGHARAEPMLFGVAWFLLGLAPHVASLPLLGLYANRYAYFPAMGLVLVLA
jgi:hypothetical protein